MHDQIDTIYSLTPLQKGLLFHEAYTPESRVYYQQMQVRLRGALDEPAFRQAWRLLMQRHDVLRTAFLWEELDDAFQVVLREAPLPLREVDLRGDAAGLAALAAAERAPAFDLAQAPLMRLALARLDDATDGTPQWALLWTHHHLLLDGWSVGLLLGEWCELYRAARRGTPQALAAVRPFRDYVAYLDEHPFDESFWKARLGDFAATTPLPGFDPRGVGRDEMDGLPCTEHVFTLDAPATQRLADFARRHGLTLATLLQAAYAYLLGRHAGRDEAVIGVTVAGRPDRLAGAEHMVGLFINTLPLRVRWEDAPSVGTWLARIQAWNAEMREHEHAPLARLRALTALPAGGELFEAILVFENFPFPRELDRIDTDLVSLADPQEAAALRHTQGRNNYPLSLIASLEADVLQLHLVHQRRRLSDAAGARLLRQLVFLLDALAADAERPLAELPLCPPEEHTLTLGWGTGKTVPVPAAPLHELILAQARRHPQREAVRDAAGALSYAELETAAARLACRLRADGLQDGDVVALALPRSTQAVVSLLAVLQAGGCFLPLELAQPATRLAAVVAASGARFVIGRPAFDVGSARSVDPDAAAPAGPQPALPSVAPESAAYLIYTSGSTGTPKGVRVPHRAIVAYVSGILDALGLADATAPAWRHALLSTLAADLGYTQLFGALASGGSLLLVDDDTRADPQALARLFDAWPPDLAKLTPSHLQGLLTAHPSAALLPRRALLLGGEALPHTLVEVVRRIAPQLPVYNHYGPTESAVGVMLARIGQPIEGVQPLGGPQPNRCLAVLDAAGRPVPVGVPGELHVGGEGLALGYLNDEAQTAARFVATADLGRAYRTGDRVCWLESGELAFLGRVDNQVKLRGYRIELGEVEAQIKRLSTHIRQVLARVVQAEGGEAPRLIAWFVADTSMSAEKLCADLALRVPDYMVPAAFVALDEIPLTSNGKPDAARLPLPDAPSRSDQGYAAPRDATETLLTEIWQSVLRKERVGIHDNFFALGGDSILNLQIIARAHQHGLKLTPKQLFEHRTIAEIAAVTHASGTALPEARSEVPAVALTAGQLARLEAGPLGASWRCVALQQPIVLDVLHQAVRALQRHHRSLQIGLQQQPDGRWLATLPPVTKPVDASRHPGDDTSNEALCALAECVLSGLDHAGGEGLHACLLDEGHAVLLVAHPLRLDEASWPQLLADLELALGQAAHGRDIALSPHGGDASEWAAHQHRYAGSDATEAAWEYWLQHAGEEAPCLPVPADASARHVLALPAELSARLALLQRRRHVPWQTLLVTALAAELAEAVDRDAVWLALDTGRAERARLPVDAPLARTGFDPDRIVAALSCPTPLYLRVPRDAAPAALLAGLDAQLATAPHAGDDYGVLRHLSDNAYLREPLLELPRPQIGLSWLGCWDGGEALLGPILAASSPAGGAEALQVNASLLQGRLHLDCHGPLAESWALRLQRRLAALADAADDSTLPSAHAFPLCPAAATDLAALARERAVDWAQIEDIYPLSPMQEGMLLHTLLRPNSGIYLMQQRYRWDGEIDRGALEYAWAQQLARHPILRTGFWWQDGRAPLQCVHRDTDPAFAWYDWRGLDADVQQRQLETVLATERHRGFDMRRPPLTFLRVFQIGDQAYLIVRSFHHILTDAWCFGLLMSDLFAHYQARVLGQPAARPLAPPYRDYIHWLRRQDLARTEAFWRQELAGFTAPTPLVVDRPLAPGRQAGEDIGNADLTLSIAETRELNALCQQHQLTANTWVQGAWALLLSRYCGSPDVLFGVTVAGRPADLPGVEHIVGLFINSLPLRVRVDDSQPVLAWLQRLLERNIELRAHEYAPLVEIQRWSEIERGRSLFDSLVVFENAPFEAGLAECRHDFSVDIYEDRVHTNYPMTVVLYPGDRLGIRLSYDRERFEPATVERILEHLRELLRQMVQRPQAPLGSLTLLTVEEQQALLEWNRSEQDFPLDQTYAALWARRVADHPERIAAVCRGEALSYAELDQRSNRLARALREAGARPDGLVALAAERGLALLTMMVAVLKSGAAYLPLDIHHPPQRLAQILDLSRAPIVLASDSAMATLDRALAGAATPVRVLRTEALWLEGDASPPAPSGGPDSLAYVIFTSGSTGVPKGAMVEQRGMLNNIFGKVPALGLSAQDRIAQTASPAFDISVWQFLAAPLLGATVHILPDEVAHDPARLLDTLERDGLTVLEAVPTVIRALLEATQADRALASLRWLLPTGEALPPALARQWLTRFPCVPLMNAYGPAECSDDVAFHPLLLPPAEEGAAIPIGRPTANNRLYLLDEARRPLPVGVPGEICVAGVGVGRGYLNDPEKTSAAFVAHPFEPGQRFYRTGDLGRRRADGVIEFLGRRDQQVKVRGHRIEMGEIEDRLGQHPAVEAAAVVARNDARGDTQLVAYWTQREAAQQEEAASAADAAALRDWLSTQLPSYMVPAHLVRLDRMPLNANGKIDRKLLSARELDVTAKRTSVAPRTATEQRLATIWAELLSLPGVEVEDSFFALGGHSLLATQVVSRIRSQLQVELPLRAVFEHPTLAALARAVEAAREGQAQAVLPALTPQPRPQRIPLSFAQQRLWFLEQLAPGSSELNIPFALTLGGTLDTQALQRSFQDMIDRHEVLRTTMHSDDGEPWQRVEPRATLDLPLTDLRHRPAGERDDAVRDHLDGAFRQPFDLTRAPLLRAELLRLGEEEHVLVVVLHHIAADAWSIALLVDDLAQAYGCHRAGAAPDFAPAPLQYADFALWQRQYLPGAVWQQQLAYWRGQLAGSPPVLRLPGAQDGSTRQAARHRRHLPAALAQALQRRADAEDATLFMVLYAALNVLLHQQTGRTDLLVGADVANRHREETEAMVGFFVNQLVLRCRIAPEQSFHELLSACRRTTLEAYQHQDLPFDALVAELLPQRDARHTPFFQVKLVLQNTRQRHLELPGLRVEELELPPQAGELDLLVNVVADGDGLLLVYDHDSARYPPHYIEMLDACLVALLEAVAEQADIPVGELAQQLLKLQQPAQCAPSPAARPSRETRQTALGQARRKAIAL